MNPTIADSYTTNNIVKKTNKNNTNYRFTLLPLMSTVHIRSTDPNNTSKNNTILDQHE